MEKTKDRSKTAPKINPIQSVERAVMILDHLRRGPVSLSELSRELGLNKSTLHGLLQTLVKHNYVRQEPGTGHYRLGYRVLALGAAYLEHCNLRETAAPYLRQLVGEHGETVHLVVMDDAQVVYVDKIDSPQSIRMVSRIGRRLPAHCTGVGKAILAFLPEEQMLSIISKRALTKYTPATITTLEELVAELARIREEGVSYDREEIEEGLRCVAVPIIGYGRHPVGAISVSGPAWRMTDGKMSQIAGSLKTVARDISLQMGEGFEEMVPQSTGVRPVNKPPVNPEKF